VRIALASLDQAWERKAENLVRCRNLLATAYDYRCELVIFPEMTLTGFSLDVDSTAEQVDESVTMAAFAKLAFQWGVNIIFGCCLHHGDDTRAQNVLCLARPTGHSKTVYAKLHPFSFADEQRVIKSGDRLGFIELPTARLGASICYDLRFPVPFALMAPYCAGVVCIANWPERRIHHWRNLLIARAIENQMFMIGVNRIGVDGNGLRYVKSSMVVAPDGEVIAPVSSNDELDVYDIDESSSAKYRAEFPTLRDGDFSLYFRLKDWMLDDSGPAILK